jgi:hypothetical protein
MYEVPRRAREASTAAKIAVRDRPMVFAQYQCNNRIRVYGLTSQINIVLTLIQLLHIQRPNNVRLITNMKRALGHNNDLLAGDIKLLQGLPNDLLAQPIRVRVRRVPGINADVVGSLEDSQGRFLVQDPRHQLGSS